MRWIVCCFDYIDNDNDIFIFYKFYQMINKLIYYHLIILIIFYMTYQLDKYA